MVDNKTKQKHLICSLIYASTDIHKYKAFRTQFNIKRLRDWDWDKFIQHKMTLYRCMISDIHDSSYVLFSTNLISHTNLHVGRPLLRPFLVAYAEATLARQKKIAQQTKSVDIISEYLLWTNGQLFEMNVKIVSSYWQAGKAFDPLQHD